MTPFRHSKQLRRRWFETISRWRLRLITRSELARRLIWLGYSEERAWELARKL